MVGLWGKYTVKLISIAVQQFWGYLKKKPMLVLFFFFGITLSVMILIYCYGNLMPQKIRETITYPEYRTVKVVFSEPVTLEEAQLHLMDDYDPQDVYVEHVTDKYLNLYDANLVMRSYLYNNRGEEITFCPLFSNDELAEDKIILSPAYDGETITLDNHTYEIAKKVSFLSDQICFIPIRLFFQNDLRVDAISYVFPDFSFLKDIATINQRLLEEFPNGTTVNPEDRLAGLEPQQIQAIIRIGVIFLICLIFFLLIYRTMILENNHERAIYGLVGASQGQLLQVILWQTVFLFSAAFFVALLIHLVGYGFFNQWLNFAKGISYSFEEYAVLYLFVIFCALFVQTVNLLSFSRKTLKERVGG